MEDVITAVPPPSRFFLEDLNNFTPPSPPIPPPFLLFSTPNQSKPICPSLLIIALSSPSLHFFHHISTKTLIGSVILPEIPFSGNTIEPSLRDKSCNIYTLTENDNLIVIVSVQYQVSAERSHAVAKLLIGEQIVPEKVLILDSIQSRNFRGKLSPDETFAFKLETSQQRKRLGNDGCGDSSLLKGIDYFPSGSMVDGLSAALLGQCQMKKIKGTLCVSWPEFGGSVASLVKSLLLKDVLPGFEYSIVDGEGGDSCLSLLDAGGPPPLTLDYYASTCPNALDIVKKEMECAVMSDPRNAAFILRLHFHDCFVQGCDGSVLLDDTFTLQGEKKAAININALKGFRIIDRIKNKLESECPGTVSCADILTIAARDAVILVGGPDWDVPLGRNDSKTAGYAMADQNLPTSDEGLVSIISKFVYQGLSVTDMVALSGAHTIGMGRCVNFRERIYGDFDATSGGNPSSETYLNSLKAMCPAAGGGDNDETAMDYITPKLFDNYFYQTLLKGEGLLNSDQELYSSVFGIQTKKLVQMYAEDQMAFFEQFSQSMVKLGNITNPDTYDNGEVRKNCRFVNT
ncbi:Peroxidase 11 [Camellia lanceoleosa]|uniref:Peroxidase 11 n=1 Tax=Camellia lanceoleosa TaxID=1840588 RepID=A0ACC0G902_9ERIC|nr:Peroxidase 11 [Camellia lanceoleosa]